MRISVIGCGYLGTVHATAMAELGHEVVGVDIDRQKIAQLSQGTAPFYEPHLQEMLTSDDLRGRLTFTTDIAHVADASVHFIAVDTPQSTDTHAADLRFVESAVTGLIPVLTPGDLVIGKSTVPVGTAARLAAIIAPTGATLVWNPEFLREGYAVNDTLRPDRLVYGVPEGPNGERATAILDEIYAVALAAGTPRVVTNLETAELVKVAANAFLATKISFINAMAEVADVVGADVTQLATAIGHDQRIGHRYLGAGIGFGGGCLPKDIRAFVARAEELGTGDAVAFLREVDEVNLRSRERAVALTARVLGGDVRGKRIAVLGAAFKPDSDDTRDSPGLSIALSLDKMGAEVIVTDPRALPRARVLHPHLNYADSTEHALRDADAVVLVTEWDEYRHHLDPNEAADLVRSPHIIDGRNCLDRSVWRAAGWTYYGLGIPDAS